MYTEGLIGSGKTVRELYHCCFPSMVPKKHLWLAEPVAAFRKQQRSSAAEETPEAAAIQLSLIQRPVVIHMM